MRKLLLVAVVVLLSGLGCAPPADTPPPPDLEATRAALIAADEAWFAAYSAADNPADAFVAGVEADAYVLPPDAPIAHGAEAIHALITALESMPGFSVSWTPSAAEVAAGADLGYTIGAYEMTVPGPDGALMHVDGKYLTVWRQQADGTWKVTADMFNADGPPVPIEQ